MREIQETSLWGVMEEVFDYPFIGSILGFADSKTAKTLFKNYSKLLGFVNKRSDFKNMMFSSFENISYVYKNKDGDIEEHPYLCDFVFPVFIEESMHLGTHLVFADKVDDDEVILLFEDMNTIRRDFSGNYDDQYLEWTLYNLNYAKGIAKKAVVAKRIRFIHRDNKRVTSFKPEDFEFISFETIDSLTNHNGIYEDICERLLELPSIM